MNISQSLNAAQRILPSRKGGRRSVPRFLYHVTSKTNYESMLKDGFINASHDANPITNLSGVFMFDLKNFTKRWCNTGFKFDKTNPFSLAKGLLLKSASNNSDIVVLKIPTKDLSLDKLKCRTQDITSNPSISHILDGDFAIRQKHYTGKKQPIEYIFQEPIPMSSVQKIGEANTGVSLENMINIMDPDMYKNFDIKNTLTNLFKGQPEEKCINLANSSNIKFKDMNY